MAHKSNGIETDWARAPPPSGPVWLRLAKAIYNPEEKSFLGRTPKRWGIVLAFYLFFYAGLALLFSLCMGGLYYTLDNKKPTWTLDKSLIGTNPGLASRPIPLEGLVVRYENDSASYERYITELDYFFEPYGFESWYRSKSECKTADGYGYPDTPCFFVKLNKIYDWVPDVYDDVSSLPAEMPKDLVEYIKSREPDELNQVWMSCWDEQSNDTLIEYPWGRGLSGRFFPYRNKDGYRSPLLAVRITPPVNTVVTIRCRAWAKNIIYNKSLKEPSGYTRIQFQIPPFTREENNIANFTTNN